MNGLIGAAAVAFVLPAGARAQVRQDCYRAATRIVAARQDEIRRVARRLDERGRA